MNLKLEHICMVDIEQLRQDLDWKAVAILDELQENGGQANTTQLKHATGWNSSVIHYRYDKLVDAGLIVTQKGHTDTDRIPPTVATLTNEGEEAIEHGIIEDYDLKETTVKDLKEKIEHLEHQQRRLESQLEDRTTHYDAALADHDTRIEDIEDGLREAAEQSTLRQIFSR
jgi:DNA-binding MarR family transcriptional regulator